MGKPRILIIDDNETHNLAVEEGLERVGYRCKTAATGREALSALEQESFDLVITDLRLPDVGGLEILKTVKENDLGAEVIVVTGHGSVESAVAAMKDGASDYLTKPVNLEELRTKVKKALEKQQLSRENKELHEVLEKRLGFEGISGSSPRMQRIFDVIRQIAPTDTTVLITGESGTGKELVARAIHNRSRRKGQSFVAINCAAFAEGVLESELFGHEKGAFTGAVQKRLGRVESANKGTLFLDEVGEMPLATQVKLLRVIEQREITRVGSNAQIDVDVRFLAATNRNLKAAIADGTFREDLYFRLKVVNVEIPPLRERPEDIPPLIDQFLSEFASKHHKKVDGISHDARNSLMSYEWPGNVRELRNAVENMVVFSRTSELSVQDLPLDITPAEASPPLFREKSDGARSLASLERHAIEDALSKVDGNREKAAQMLGISERTLYRKIKVYELK